MMRDILNKDSLTHEIGYLGNELIQARQVYSRLQSLLPARFAEIVASLRSPDISASKARRLACLDSRYIAYLDELNQLGHQIVKARIRWETHRMLFQYKFRTKHS